MSSPRSRPGWRALGARGRDDPSGQRRHVEVEDASRSRLDDGGNVVFLDQRRRRAGRDGARPGPVHGDAVPEEAGGAAHGAADGPRPS